MKQRTYIPPAEEGAGNLTDQDRLDGSYTHPIQPTTLPTPRPATTKEAQGEAQQTTQKATYTGFIHLGAWFPWRI